MSKKEYYKEKKGESSMNINFYRNVSKVILLFFIFPYLLMRIVKRL